MGTKVRSESPRRRRGRPSHLTALDFLELAQAKLVEGGLLTQNLHYDY
ncbi:MAG: hypothetical protein LBU12_07210 [Deltaproteobacteria bacterium]|nr:hypothetical protein [Deltaproteobacteria bacterium]